MSFDEKYKVALRTESKLCDNAQLFGAFAQGDRLTFTVSAERRSGISKLRMRLYNDATASECYYFFDYCGMSEGCDKYKLVLDLNEPGLFYYDISYEDINGVRYLNTAGFFESVTLEGTSIDYIKYILVTVNGTDVTYEYLQAVK